MVCGSFGWMQLRASPCLLWPVPIRPRGHKSRVGEDILVRQTFERGRQVNVSDGAHMAKSSFSTQPREHRPARSGTRRQQAKNSNTQSNGTTRSKNTMRNLPVLESLYLNAGPLNCVILPHRGLDDVTAPGGIDVPRWDRNNPCWEAVMSEIVPVGLDLAKTVFQVHGSDSKGHAVLRKKLGRAQVLEFFAKLPPCLMSWPSLARSRPRKCAPPQASIATRQGGN